MVQVIQGTNKWATAGYNAGQGFGDQIPKEVEHYRLSQGLKNLGEQKNLTPMQYATQAASIYGMTPEMHRQFGQLAREQGNRNAYQNLAGQGEQPDERGFKGDEFKPPKIGSSAKNLRNIQPGVSENAIVRRENQASINPQEENKPSIVNTNPTSREQDYVPDWSPSRRIQETARVMSQFPQFTPEQVSQMVNANEESYKSLPETERKNYERQEQIKDATDRKLEIATKRKLQTPQGKEIFDDVTGENYEAVKRELEKDIRNNPDVPIDEQVDKWSQHLVDFADKKQELKVLANRNFADRWLGQGKTLKSLESYQKAFQKTGNLKEFHNILRKSKKDGGFDMSNGGADQITYPRSKEVKSLINNMPRIQNGKAEEQSRNLAKQIVEKNYFNSKESPLAIARDARDKDPLFNIEAFLDYFKDNYDQLPLLPFQQKAIEARQGSTGGYWGDYFILPNKRNEK